MPLDEFWHVYTCETIPEIKIMHIAINPRSFLVPLCNPSLLLPHPILPLSSLSSQKPDLSPENQYSLFLSGFFTAFPCW